jgi:hypothetical protein
MKALFVVLFFLMTAFAAAAADGPCVVEGRGHFQIRTGTGGLFGIFGHDHLIEAKRIEGCAAVDAADLKRSSIKLTFTTADIRVTDPGESEGDRAKVQEDQRVAVPRIHFRLKSGAMGT